MKAYRSFLSATIVVGLIFVCVGVVDAQARSGGDVSVESLGPRQLLQYRALQLVTGTVELKLPDPELIESSSPSLFYIPAQIAQGIPRNVAIACSNGGSADSVVNDADKNNYTSRGDVYSVEFKSCREGPLTLSGSVALNIVSDTAFLDRRITSVDSEKKVNLKSTFVEPTVQFEMAVEGTIRMSKRDSTEQIRAQALTYSSGANRFESNAELDTDLGSRIVGTPFTIRSITGNVKFDGEPYVLSSTPITGTNVEIVGKTVIAADFRNGIVRATARSGDAIVATFSSGGRFSCAFVPSGNNDPTVVVDQCGSLSDDPIPLVVEASTTQISTTTVATPTKSAKKSLMKKAGKAKTRRR